MFPRKNIYCSSFQYFMRLLSGSEQCAETVDLVTSLIRGDGIVLTSEPRASSTSGTEASLVAASLCRVEPDTAGT